MLEISGRAPYDKANSQSHGLRSKEEPAATSLMDPQHQTSSTPSEPDKPAGTAYLYEIPGKALSIYVDFDLIDRLGFEIMRGFGAVPRRGAEVGGLLLGSAEVGDRTSLRIEDFVPVSCEHKRGPSYILSDADFRALDEAIAKWAPAPDKRIYVVGFYRSNTRDTLQLAAEDLALLEQRLPMKTAVCLLVKPYATRASEATFFFRENGAFPEEPATSTFPFRRKELGGGKPTRRPRGAETPDPELETAATGYNLSEEPQNRPQPTEEIELPALAALSQNGLTAAGPRQQATLDQALPDPLPRSKYRSGWIWIPLSFIFLLLGVVLGFQIALSYKSQKAPDAATDPYLLDLTLVQFGENLHLKWNTDTLAFRNARRGLLHIQDGDNSKTVELKPEDLTRGGVLYRNATNNVRFKLEVFPRDRVSVSESLETRLLEDSKSKEAAK